MQERQRRDTLEIRKTSLETGYSEIRHGGLVGTPKLIEDAYDISHAVPRKQPQMTAPQTELCPGAQGELSV